MPLLLSAQHLDPVVHFDERGLHVKSVEAVEKDRPISGQGMGWLIGLSTLAHFGSRAKLVSSAHR